jgi:DNA-binding MarR family transcriptional regulator
MKQKTIEYALRSTWQLITTMYNEKALKYDATMTMAFTLLSIDAGGTPSTALGPKMGMESTSLSRLLNTMEERGYIERRPNPEDGRGVLIFLTQQGKEKRAL